MSTTKALKARRSCLLDGVPPDKRVVIADVTWDVYESLIDSIREGENCRVAFDGKDIEMMTVGPWHEAEKSILEAVEIDISPPKIDRPGIYAALKVPEFW